MRPLLLPLVLVAAAWAGCVGDADPVETLGDEEVLAAANATRELLNQTPHLQVFGWATLVLRLPNATAEAPEMASVLVYLENGADVTTVSKDGNPLLVAVIPHDAWKDAPSCAPVPPGTGAYFRPADGAGPNAVGNLTQPYAKGWHHVVVVADQPTTTTITLGASEHRAARTLPGPDPFILAGGQVHEGGRSASAHIDGVRGAWAAWATHTIAGGGGGGFIFNNIDGGHSHRLTMNGECAQASRQNSGPFIQNPRNLHVHRVGNGTQLEVQAAYEPNQPAVAPMSTTLWVAWVGLDPDVRIALPAQVPR